MAAITSGRAIGTIDILERPPVYIVLFASSEFDQNESPLLAGEPQDTQDGTVPHGLSHDVVRALPALWYCLHLPGSFTQLLDLSVTNIRRSQQLSLGQNIWLAPASVFESFWLSSDISAEGIPVLILAPTSELDYVTEAAERLEIKCPVADSTNLSQSSLHDHWQHIRSLLSDEIDQLESEIKLTSRIDTAPTYLPFSWLARQLHMAPAAEPQNNEDVTDTLHEHLNALLTVSSLAKLEEDGVTRDVANELIPGKLKDEFGRLSVPVALGFPGVPAIYTRRVYTTEARAEIRDWQQIDPSNNWGALQDEKISSELAERSAIEFVVTHRAIARGGVGLMMRSVPQRLYQLIDQIERHCIARAHGPTVWKLLRRLHSASEDIWDGSTVAAVARASHLTVFSNFPVGLLRLPNTSAPILSRTPISYRPIMPITRAIQHENDSNYSRSFPTRRVRVLVIECIDPSDRIAKTSRAGWELAKEFANEASRPLDFQIRESLSVESLKATIKDNPCDILVISAHGFYNVQSNIAGLTIGSEPTLGIGLGPLPPIVILSACHVSPMGIGAVRVVDMLLREGAMAVLGTQIPVEVRHNATMMSRLFVYIAEALKGNGSHITLADIWQHVQASNPINDIVNGNQHLANWLLEPRVGKPTRLVEFMTSASAGRLRSTHVFEDTEAVLLKMAESEGRRDVILRWLKDPGYLPESMFYAFWGSPERVFVNYPPAKSALAHAVEDKHRDRTETTDG